MPTEIASTYRVYRKEWLFEGRYPGMETAQARMAERYEGRYRDEDVQFHADAQGVVLVLRRWNVAGEWKRLSDAETHSASLAGEVKIVSRNSRAEFLLRNYGTLKIAT